ncbi:MAG: esterase FrsA [Psychromonas sp.]
MSENLSKSLFTYKPNVQETSTIVPNHSTKKNLTQSNITSYGEEKVGWYRLLKLMQWSWQGLDIIECYEVLARISASENKRSDESILDTVIGFRPGNWNYEWTQHAMYYYKQGNQFAAEAENDKAKHAYYLASQFYCVASYPHLRGDELAIQTQTLAFNSYKESFKYSKKMEFKEIKVPYQGKEVTCFLHLPDTETIHPVVIVSGGIDALQCELLSLFEKELAPQGIAMLTVDLPGVGFSSHVKLNQNSSDLHQAIIHHMKQVPWVDHDRIALMGMRFGGNIAMRLGFLEPGSVKSVICVGAAVGSVFDKLENFKKLPPVLLDCIASRMHINNSSSESLFQFCVPLSLVKQGLLGRTRIKTPLLSIGHKDDIICNEQDLQLIGRASHQGESKIIEKHPIFESYLNCLTYSAKWLTRHLGE